jgi:hypothetical protein
MRANKPRRSRPTRSFAPRQKEWRPDNPRSRSDPQRRSQNARQSYERYLALAQAEARAGNEIAAENYYQHAEHYYRIMSSDQAR